MTHFPELVEWEITDACDLSCRHCHRRDRVPGRELSAADRLVLADRLVAAGVKSLTLSGGEPTLCDQLWPVVERFKAAGVFVSLITNGRDDSDAFAARCADSALDFVWLSLDGLQETHDRIRRREGAFARLLRTAENLASHDVHFGFMTTLLRPNVPELDAISRLVGESGADLWQVALGLPNGHEADLWLRAADLPGLREDLLRLAADNPRLILGEALAMALELPAYRFVGQAAPERSDGFSGCPAGSQGLALSPDGRIRGCSCLPGDASEKSLLEVGDVAATLDAERNRAAGLQNQLRERILQAGWPVSGGFCRALALRCAPLPCATMDAGVFSRSAGRVALGSALLAGLISCGPQKGRPDEKTTPPDSGKPTAMAPAESNQQPPVEPSVKGEPATVDPAATGDGTPAGKGPAHDTTNVVAPTAMNPGMKAEPWVMPSCCMSHVLVPDCKCSPPPGTIPNP